MHIAEDTTVGQLDEQAILIQMERIQSSRLFSSSPRMSHFLSYVVQSALQGDFLALKETCIGIEVFQRRPDYDPREDGIVRVEARRLRQKLEEYYGGDGGADEWLIEIPRGGYRPSFTYRPVEVVQVDSAPIPTLQLQEPAPKTLPAISVIQSGSPAAEWKASAHWMRWVVPASVLLLLSCSLVIWYSLTRSHLHNAAFEVKNLTTYIGQEMHPTISPDGREFAFVWDGDHGKYDIYIGEIAGKEHKQLTSEPGHNLYPQWSPDGRDIAYVNVTPYKLILKLRPSIGDQPRIISEFSPTTSPWHEDARQITSLWSAGWTPDGRNLITNITDTNKGKDRLALFSIQLSGGPEKELTYPPSGASDFEPVVSPDGHQLAFYRATSKLTGDIWLLDLLSGKLKQLTFDRSDIRGINWLQNSRALLYSGNKNGPYSIYLISTDSGKESAIPTSGTNATDPLLLPDGDHLIFTDSQMNSNIWIQRLNSLKPQSKPTRLIASSLTTHSARFSPDGQRIAFVSNRSGHWEIWVADSNGLNPSQLTSFNGPLVDAPHWSPDSAKVVFEARPDGRSALFRVELSTRTVTRLTDGKANDKMPVWSHDGKSIYFNSDVNGLAQIWKMSTDGTNKKLLSTQMGYDVVEMKDRPILYFLSGDQFLYRMSSDGGPTVRMNEVGPIGLSRYFDASDKNLFFIKSAATPYTVECFDFRTGQIAKIATIDAEIVSSTPSLSISSDGNLLIYAVQENGSGDIKMLTLPPLHEMI